MQTLADLQNIFNELDTFGFDPSQIKVDMKYSFSTMKIQDAKLTIDAVDKTVKPTLIIELDVEHSSRFMG